MVGRLALACLHYLIYLQSLWTRLLLRWRYLWVSVKGENDRLGKLPGHVLIIAKGRVLSVPLCERMLSLGIRHLSVQSEEQQPCLLVTHENYQPIKDNEDAPMAVNLVTEDGLRTMCKAVSRFDNHGANLTEEQASRAITNLPMLDLIINLKDDLTVGGCVPWLIGFAEICHLPGLPVDVYSLQLALRQYAACQQRFGK